MDVCMYSYMSHNEAYQVQTNILKMRNKTSIKLWKLFGWVFFFFVGQKDELIDFVFISNNPEGIAIKIYCDISFAISNFATESPMSKTTTNFSRRTHSLTHNYNWLSSNNRKIIDKVKHINLEMMQLHAHTPFVICVCTLQPAQNNGPNALAQF